MSDDPEVPTDDARRFESLLGRVLSVSKDELKRREAEYQKEREEKREETRKRNSPTARP
jgi:hypothetical protein